MYLKSVYTVQRIAGDVSSLLIGIDERPTLYGACSEVWKVIRKLNPETPFATAQ
jgi:hypothetical protein